MKLQEYLPMLLISITISSCNGCGDPQSACECENEKHIEGYATLGPANQTAVLSTYDTDGGFTADGGCHANMIISYHWSDSARAASEEMPCLNYSFETVNGYFPIGSESLTKEWDSYHGYYHWGVNINEASDFSNPEAILYKIVCTYNSSCQPPGDIELHAEMFYKVYNEAQYEREEKDPCAN
ncbi:MAG: hypothetical protein GC178_14140 [Flavobacteriales bacterium]|nr:hypothetical protein [Flavobacteriales bacterium]